MSFHSYRHDSVRRRDPIDYRPATRLNHEQFAVGDHNPMIGSVPAPRGIALDAFDGDDAIVARAKRRAGITGGAL